MSGNVGFWWISLCVVAAINLIAWAISAVALRRQRGQLSSEVYDIARLQLLLSGIYAFGCAFRSAMPVYDIPRIVLVDSWLSSVMVGRSVATLAELCFAAQWALLLREMARVTGNIFVMRASAVIVPLILTAEVCSWYAVLTTWNFGHVAENSLWGLTGTIVLVSLLAVGPYGLTVPRWVFFTWCLGGAAYVAFIFFIDVPMYWSRWVADELSGRSYMTLAQGARDAIERRVVSYRWEDWKSEVGWMSLYFSAGVWVSLSLIRARAEYAVARTSSALRLPQ